MADVLLRTETKGRDDSGITSRTLGGLFWTFVGTGVQVGLQLLVLVVLARLLTPTDFGMVAAAMVVVGFSAIFSQCAIGPAVVQRLELRTAHLRTGFTLCLVFGVLLAALLWLSAPAVAGFFRLEELTAVLRILCLLFPIQGLSLVAEALLQRELRFRALAVLEVIAVTLGYGGIGILLAVLGFGVWALVGAHLAQTVLKTILLLVVQPHPMWPQLEKRALSDFMYFGGGFMAAQISNYFAGQGDNLVVGRCLSAAALGVYGRAYQLMAGPAVFFGQVLDRVLFPAMAKVQHEPERLAEAYRRGVALIALVMLPASAVLAVLAPEFIRVLLGPEWDQVIIPFQILVVGMLFRTSYKLSDALVRATGAVYRRAWRQAAYAMLVVGSTLVGQQWGLPGVALAVLVTLACNFFLMAHLSLKLAAMPWRTFLAAHLPGLALAGVVGMEAWVIAEVLRDRGATSFWVLLTSVAATLPSLLLVWWLPQLFLGQEGRWMLRTLVRTWFREQRVTDLTKEAG